MIPVEDDDSESQKLEKGVEDIRKTVVGIKAVIKLCCIDRNPEVRRNNFGHLFNEGDLLISSRLAFLIVEFWAKAHYHDAIDAEMLILEESRKTLSEIGLFVFLLD
jgi:hypothetical protein